MDAVDERNLYEIWDNDLKKCMTRRHIAEALAVIWVFLSLANVIEPSIELFIAVLAAIIYFCVTQFIDESNVNYLMHNADWSNAMSSFNE